MTPAAYRIDGELVSREAFYALACDPARSLAVQACAGAGKTWMLVSRILRALLDGCAPQDILAITFTKKAAGEMRARLNQELRRCASLSDDELAQALRERGLSAADARARAAELRGLQQRVDAHGRSVQLRTFHSWFAALLRSAPLSVLQQLRLPPQYELLEDDSLARAQVWPHFYAALASRPLERQDYMDCVAEHGRHQTQQALENALQKRVEFALADAAGVVQTSVQPFGQLYPELAALATPTQYLAQPGPEHAVLWAGARALGGAHAPSFVAKGVALEQALSACDVAALLDALLTKERGARKFSEKIKDLAAVRAAQDLALRLHAALEQHAAWQHQQRMARLVRVLLCAYADGKRERGWVDMGDVELAAQRLLGDATLSGWLQQRLDARVRHLLIDEFQDTNPLQWQALHGWLSGYVGAGAGQAPSVFLVGDPKQSIYRFRRAEPQVFLAAQDFVRHGLAGALLSCDHTRRCAPQVVHAVNTVLLTALQAGEYSGDFRAHSTESTAPGAVLALPQIARSQRSARAQPGAGDAPALWRDSLRTPRVLPEDSLAALEAQQAADWLAAEIASGRLQPGQVMVLSRRRERLAWLHTALLERGIASEQPEKLDLCQAPAVQDVVALLDVLVSNRHDLSLARALKSPLFGWSDELLAQLARLQRQACQHTRPDAGASPALALKPAWWDVLQELAAVPPEQQVSLLRPYCPDGEAAQTQAALLRTSAERLVQYRDWLRSLPPHDALSAIYQHGDLLARFAQAVPASQREGVLTPLRDLLTQSLALDGGRFLTPYRLVRALKAGGLAATPVQTPAAVRLLTIHGAKGLEADTVLMLDTDSAAARPASMDVLVDWPGQASAPRRFVFLLSEKTPPACALEALQLEQQARLLEEFNACYVALTRAERRLVLSSFEPHQRGNGPSWFERLRPLASVLDAPVALQKIDVAVPAAAHAAAFTLPELPCSAGWHAPPPAATAAGSTAAAPGADAEQARIGQALHRLLQWHPTPGGGFDWTAAHEQAVAREFGLSAEQARLARTMARRMVQGEAAWVWDCGVIDHWSNEVELLHQGQGLRLDRLVRQRSSGIWWVLDFKSAARPEQQPELLAQMHRYQQAMAQTLPGQTVRLAFINALGRVIELTYP
ncbi:UvrD-helicase domain-containing protein [Hydrogenophaga sp.]|uniref:UvrD-helicase domain-containing protein n=1 Tax=Hydrogenophaga sp. TaxID=1904254 RepID=UPI0019A7585B|nr:UvrD-helicase domain-containing protein [Hydrogenophaga sp.]MBD3892944.1 DNA helicase UvrD [Hydrogenophaga sp.]